MQFFFYAVRLISKEAGDYLIIILASQVCPPAGRIRSVGEAFVSLSVKDCR
jgi:hypothetical protein